MSIHWLGLSLHLFVNKSDDWWTMQLSFHPNQPTIQPTEVSWPPSGLPLPLGGSITLMPLQQGETSTFSRRFYDISGWWVYCETHLVQKSFVGQMNYHGNGGRGFFLDSFKEGPAPLTLEIETVFWGSVTRIFGIPSNFILQNQVKGNIKVVIGCLHSSFSLWINVFALSIWICVWFSKMVSWTSKLPIPTSFSPGFSSSKRQGFHLCSTSNWNLHLEGACCYSWGVTP